MPFRGDRGRKGRECKFQNKSHNKREIILMTLGSVKPMKPVKPVKPYKTSKGYIIIIVIIMI